MRGAGLEAPGPALRAAALAGRGAGGVPGVEVLCESPRFPWLRTLTIKRTAMDKSTLVGPPEGATAEEQAVYWRLRAEYWHRRATYRQEHINQLRREISIASRASDRIIDEGDQDN